MDPINVFDDWFARNQPNTRTMVLLAFGVAAAASLTGAVLLAGKPVAPILGAAAGVCLYLAVFGFWRHYVPAAWRTAADVEARQGIQAARIVCVAAAGLWTLSILLLGKVLPAPLLGTGTVVVALTLFRTWPRTPLPAGIDSEGSPPTPSPDQTQGPSAPR